MKRIACITLVMLFTAMANAQTGSSSGSSQNPSSSSMPSSSMPSSQSPSSSGQSGSSSADEQQLLGLEQQWADAAKSGDASALSRIEADSYVMTNPMGKVTGKQDDVNGLKSGQTKYQSFELSDLQAHVYGDTGVVTGKANLKGMDHGQDITGSYAFTDTFVRRNGQWQAVATETTRLPGSQPPQQ